MPRPGLLLSAAALAAFVLVAALPAAAADSPPAAPRPVAVISVPVEFTVREGAGFTLNGETRLVTLKPPADAGSVVAFLRDLVGAPTGAKLPAASGDLRVDNAIVLNFDPAQFEARLAEMQRRLDELGVLYRKPGTIPRQVIQ